MDKARVCREAHRLYRRNCVGLTFSQAMKIAWGREKERVHQLELELERFVAWAGRMPEYLDPSLSKKKIRIDTGFSSFTFIQPEVI